MRTFLEYSYNLEQVSQMFHKMRNQDPQVNISELISIPLEFVEKLPDIARADAGFVLLGILKENMSVWGSIGKYVRLLWDQPVPGAGKTLGRSLLNLISASVMKKVNADFYISYSGNISKASLHLYTGGYKRIFPSTKNYGWAPYEKMLNTIHGDYAEHLYNYRQKQKL